MAEEDLKKPYKVVELFASTADAFLQEFKDALDSNDRKAVIVASARLSQFGSTMSAFFLGGTQAACKSTDDIATANSVCKQTYKMVHDRLNAIAGKEVDEPADLSPYPALPAAPDRKLN